MKRYAMVIVVAASLTAHAQTDTVDTHVAGERRPAT